MDEHDKRDAGSSLLDGSLGQEGAPVQIYKGLPSQFEEKHSIALHVFCTVQSEDGAQEIDGV